jgi:hypothetical protein
MTYNLTKPIRTAIGVPDLVSSSQDFGVEQFFRAYDFRADDPSPFRSVSVCLSTSQKKTFFSGKKNKDGIK